MRTANMHCPIAGRFPLLFLLMCDYSRFLRLCQQKYNEIVTKIKIILHTNGEFVRIADLLLIAVN